MTLENIEDLKLPNISMGESTKSIVTPQDKLPEVDHHFLKVQNRIKTLTRNSGKNMLEGVLKCTQQELVEIEKNFQSGLNFNKNQKPRRSRMIVTPSKTVKTLNFVKTPSTSGTFLSGNVNNYANILYVDEEIVKDVIMQWPIKTDIQGVKTYFTGPRPKIVSLRTDWEAAMPLVVFTQRPSDSDRWLKVLPDVVNFFNKRQNFIKQQGLDFMINPGKKQELTTEWIKGISTFIRNTSYLDLFKVRAIRSVYQLLHYHMSYQKDGTKYFAGQPYKLGCIKQLLEVEFRSLGCMLKEEVRLKRDAKLPSISARVLRLHLPSGVYSLPSVISGKTPVRSWTGVGNVQHQTQSLGSTRSATKRMHKKPTQKAQVQPKPTLSLPDLGITAVQNVRRNMKRKVTGQSIQQNQQAKKVKTGKNIVVKMKAPQTISVIQQPQQQQQQATTGVQVLNPNQMTLVQDIVDVAVTNRALPEQNFRKVFLSYLMSVLTMDWNK